MPNDNVCSTQAATRDVGNTPPSPFQDCSDVIHISVFFDGTGNNKDADESSKKWSNPARIWRSAFMYSTDNPAANTYPIYISGVGTTFNGNVLSSVEAKVVHIEDNYLGGAGGAGGTRRLKLGVASRMIALTQNGIRCSWPERSCAS